MEMREMTAATAVLGGFRSARFSSEAKMTAVPVKDLWTYVSMA